MLEPNCNYFMFIEFTSRESECFLLSECNTTSATTCENTPDCSLAITGPKRPALNDACCDQFQEQVTCESESEIGHFYEIGEATECQNLCRDTEGCQYWSLYVQICFLYSGCTTPLPCSSVCTSGPVFPSISSCAESKDVFDTLVLGGYTRHGFYSTSVELITPNRTCAPQMDQLPVGRWDAAAAVVGSRIFYCGGYDGGFHRSCHSYDMDPEVGGGGWVEEASMTLARETFGLSAVGNTLFASGGRGSKGLSLSSVEVFSFDENRWTLESKLEMQATKYLHCSVSIGSWLYTIGGYVDGITSNLVEAFDTSLMSNKDDSVAWVKKASMIEIRRGHGCHVGVLEGQEGIYVAGGSGETGSGFLASAEFYNPAGDSWQAIGSLNTGRGHSPITMLGEKLVVSGGGGPPSLTSIETWNGTNWVELDNNLMVARESHAAVSIKTKKLSCV